MASNEELAEQHKHIAEVVSLLRWQVEQLSKLSYDILTEQPSTPEEWQAFIDRYNLIEHSNQNKQ